MTKRQKQAGRYAGRLAVGIPASIYVSQTHSVAGTATRAGLVGAGYAGYYGGKSILKKRKGRTSVAKGKGLGSWHGGGAPAQGSTPQPANSTNPAAHHGNFAAGAHTAAGKGVHGVLRGGS